MKIFYEPPATFLSFSPIFFIGVQNTDLRMNMSPRISYGEDSLDVHVETRIVIGEWFRSDGEKRRFPRSDRIISIRAESEACQRSGRFFIFFVCFSFSPPLGLSFFSLFHERRRGSVWLSSLARRVATRPVDTEPKDLHARVKSARYLVTEIGALPSNASSS